MNKFQNLGRKLGPYFCVTLKADNHYEDCLSGKRGEIWQVNETTYKAMLVTRAKDEKIYTFNIKDLKYWSSRIGKVSMSEAAYLANNPNERLK